MKPCSFIHVADLHLDSPFRGLTDTSSIIGKLVRESTFQAFQQLIELAIRLEVDFVVMSGDLFDVADRSLLAQRRLQQGLDKLSNHGIPVCIAHGNHDPENGRNQQWKWPNGVYFFASTHVETILIEKPNRGVIAQVHGISYATSSVKENLALQFSRGNQAVFQVGVLHTNVDGDPDHESYAPCSKQDLIQKGIDYWALGHVHTRKIMHENPYIVYPGNIQGRSIRELGAKGCYYVQVDEQMKCNLTFCELDQVRWLTESISIEKINNEHELNVAFTQLIREVRNQANGKHIMLRIILTGRGPIHDVLQKSQIFGDFIAELREEELMRWEDQSDGVVWIVSVEDQTAQEFDKSQWMLEPSFIGDVLRYAQHLREDEHARNQFMQELSVQIRDWPPHLTKTILESVNFQRYMDKAEDIVLDYLVQDGGVEE